MNCDSPLKFHCLPCGVDMEAYSHELLCVLVNQHNERFHPGSTTTWEPASIRFSNYYSGPDQATPAERHQAMYPAAKPKYLQRFGLVNRKPEEWGDAQKAPFISESDKLFLQKAKVKW